MDNSQNSDNIQNTSDSEGLRNLHAVGSQENAIERVLMMLRQSKNDTEKFAVLLIITKVIKSQEVIKQSKMKLINAIGLPFLKRMLKSDEVPDGCPRNIFKSIALSILSSFCYDCSNSTVLLALIPEISEIIKNTEVYEDNCVMIKDSYECIDCIVKEKIGVRLFMEYGVFDIFVKAYTADQFGSDCALNVILKVISQLGSAAWDDVNLFTYVMQHIADEFSKDQSLQKFEKCDVLVKLLHTMPTCFFDEQTSWKPLLHNGLCEIILSKLGKDQRDEGLKLAGAAIETLGISWIVSGGDRGRQLLLMTVILACVEVRMSLEDKSSDEVVLLAPQTIACYIILEYAIKFLINGAFELEEKQKQQLYASLKEAFQAVLSFLKETLIQGSTKNPRAHLFICATVRVLGAWLAEETSANKEVYEILPYIVRTAAFNFEWNQSRLAEKNLNKKGLIASQGEMPDIMRFLLPGLCHLTAEDQPRNILLENEIEQFLKEYLMHHWEIEKLKFQSNAQDTEYQSDYSYDAIITVCNIFMNIVVQEPSRTKNEYFYFCLLKTIFTIIPDIPNTSHYLQLISTTSVLGLMILRHQYLKVKSTDFMIYKFVQAVIRFLWDAYNTEDSNDYATLVVSDSYKPVWDDLMEVWYLGMHSLTLLLPNISWISEFLIDSEWPQTIISTLSIVKEDGIEASVKTAFEDFLCALVRSSITAPKLLKDCGAVSVCQNHGFKMLSEILGIKI